MQEQNLNFFKFKNCNFIKEQHLLRERLDILQEKIGYQFKDIDLLKGALTHSSSSGNFSNERLEFLGDRVLGLTISEYLYHNFIEEEGCLAKRLNFWVSRKSCADIAKKIDLGSSLFISQSEESNGGRKKDNILGNACEALIAAIYIDGGFESAREVILTLWHELLVTPTQVIDNKSALQEWTQSLGLGLPKYEVVNRSGTDHAPIFTVKVFVPTKGDTMATGKNKRLAEHEAAKKFLEIIHKQEQDDDFF